jgi:hypothetical protein
MRWTEEEGDAMVETTLKTVYISFLMLLSAVAQEKTMSNADIHIPAIRRSAKQTRIGVGPVRKIRSEHKVGKRQHRLQPRGNFPDDT